MTAPPVTWLYAVVPAALAAPPDATGVSDEPTGLVGFGDLAAVVGPLRWERPVRQQLEDPARLERAARAHHRVVDACFQAVPTVPFRLGTVLHDAHRVPDVLRAHAARFAGALRTVAHRAEWGVRAAVPATATGGGSDRPSSGVEYLRRRRTEQADRSRLRQRAVTAAAEIHDRLAGRAAAAHRHQPGSQDRRVVLNASYLLDVADAAPFVALVRELDRERAELDLRVTGPWPPYSFVDAGEGLDRAGDGRSAGTHAPEGTP